MTGLVTLLAAAVVGLGNPAGPRLYVANQSGASVTVIDVGSQSVVDTVDLTKLGFTAGCKPHDTAVEPDGSYWYVTLIADGKILKFDRNDSLVGSADFETPGMLALDPASDRLWVGRSMAAVNPPPSVGLIDRSDMSIEEIDVLFPRPHAVAVSKDGRWAYTASLAENSIAVIDAESEKVKILPVPGDVVHTFVQFAVSPDGKTLAVDAQMSGKVLVFDLTDPGSPELARVVDVGGQPWHPSFTPDGRWYVAPNLTRNVVSVLDASSWEVAAMVEGGALAQPHGSAAAGDGSLVFVSDRNTDGSWDPGHAFDPKNPPGNVVAIDPATWKIVKVMEAGPHAAGISTPRPR